MKQKTNGFAAVAVLVTVAAIAVVAALYAHNELRQVNDVKFGATVYTTQLTDTINTFRQQVNSSTANLNTELENVSTTIHTYGNIVSQNTPLPNNLGGTGTTATPLALQFFGNLGAGAGYFTLVASSGIIFATDTTHLYISTPGFDPTSNIAFTGTNTHSGSETFNGTTTFNATTTTFSKATSSILKTDASGTVSGIGIPSNGTGTIVSYNGSTWSTGIFQSSLSTSTSVATTAVATAFSMSIPALTASPSSTYEIFLQMTSSAAVNVTTTVKIGSTAIATCFENAGATTLVTLYGRLIMKQATSSAWAFISYNGFNCSSSGTATTISSLTSASTLSATVQDSATNSNTITTAAMINLFQ